MRLRPQELCEACPIEVPLLREPCPFYMLGGSEFRLRQGFVRKTKRLYAPVGAPRRRHKVRSVRDGLSAIPHPLPCSFSPKAALCAGPALGSRYRAPGGRTGQKKIPAGRRGFSKGVKLLLNVDNNAVTTVRPVPQKLRFCGNPVHFTCSAEMNSACAEIFASQKYSYGAPRRPICDGAPGGRTGAKENPRRMAGIFQGSKITPRCR